MTVNRRGVEAETIEFSKLNEATISVDKRRKGGRKGEKGEERKVKERTVFEVIDRPARTTPLSSCEPP